MKPEKESVHKEERGPRVRKSRPRWELITPVTVAIIGLIGVLGAPIIAEWAKSHFAPAFTPTPTATTTPTSTSTSTPMPTPTATPTNTPTPTPPPTATATDTLTSTCTPTVTPTNTPTPTPTPTDTPTSTPMPTDTPPLIPSTCPSADAEGTIPPAIAISSITFAVNGVEQVVRDSDALQASPGDQVRVKEVAICPVDPFEGNGGKVYVEFDPVEPDPTDPENLQKGKIIVDEVKGTTAVQVKSGFTPIPGPDYTWTIGDKWRHISVVTVHYPPGGGTQNPECEGGLCEADDRIIVSIQ